MAEKTNTIDKTSTHIVVDMLNDFITGPLACVNAENAMNHAIEYISNHPYDRVLYVCDAHPARHCSFVTEGGEWPVHAVKNTRGQEIHLSYYTRFSQPAQRPHRLRIFEKGRKADEEQYSAFLAKNSNGDVLKDVLSKHVLISGCATEYCVMQTALDLFEAGFDVSILVDGLAYVNVKDHKACLEKMKSLGIKMI